MQHLFPNFLIVGAAKSGTTTLHQLLKKHPAVYMPERKELNFWYTHGREDWAILKRFPDLPRRLEEYLEYFKGGENQIKGEASPGYLVQYEETIANLKALHPNYQQVKIIIILREPISKIWSHYKMVKRGGMDPQNYDLWTSIQQEKKRQQDRGNMLDTLPLYSTDYLPQVKAYLDNFEQVKVLLFEDLAQKTQQVLDELTDFLEVPRYVLPQEEVQKKHNAAPPPPLPDKFWLNTVRKLKLNKLVPLGLKNKLIAWVKREPPMSAKTKQFLAQHYKKDIPQLQEIIQKDLSHWMKNYQ